VCRVLRFSALIFYVCALTFFLNPKCVVALMWNGWVTGGWVIERFHYAGLAMFAEEYPALVRVRGIK
jgi:hypothetical protein